MQLLQCILRTLLLLLPCLDACFETRDLQCPNLLLGRLGLGPLCGYKCTGKPASAHNFSQEGALVSVKASRGGADCIPAHPRHNGDDHPPCSVAVAGMNVI